MKKVFVFIWGILLLLTNSSCKKETIQSKTTGDEVVIELQRIITEKSITRIYPVKYNDVIPDTYPANAGTVWKFSNGFIEINYGLNESYNLLYLHHYLIHQVQLDNNTSAPALLLYF